MKWHRLRYLSCYNIQVLNHFYLFLRTVTIDLARPVRITLICSWRRNEVNRKTGGVFRHLVPHVLRVPNNFFLVYTWLHGTKYNTAKTVALLQFYSCQRIFSADLHRFNIPFSLTVSFSCSNWKPLVRSQATEKTYRVAICAGSTHLSIIKYLEAENLVEILAKMCENAW